MEEIKDFKVDVKEISREVLWNNITKTLVINRIWDAHGNYVPWENEKNETRELVQNKRIRIERITQSWFSVEYQFYKLYIDDQPYDAMDLYKMKGNAYRLNITACMGQG